MREWIRRSTAFAVLTSILATSALVFANSDMFLKLDGIAGESQDARQKGAIEVSGWSWGASSSGGSTAVGAARGKSVIDQFVVSKSVDASSPLLLQHLQQGKVIKSATFIVRTAGAAPREFLKITLHNVSVVSIKASGVSSDARPSEMVSFNFSKVTYEYIPQDKSGKSGAAVSVEWDIASGK